MKIIDDDIDLQKLRPLDDAEFEILNNTEDAPQIVGIVDERGPTDFSDKSKWRIIADDGMGDISIKEQRTSGRDDDNDFDENSTENQQKSTGKNNSDSPDDFSPPRQKNTKSSKRTESADSSPEPSPPRKSKKNPNDSDLSPPRKSETRGDDSDRSMSFDVGNFFFQRKLIFIFLKSLYFERKRSGGRVIKMALFTL